MSLHIIKNASKYLEDYLKGTPTLDFDKIIDCFTVHTEYAKKVKQDSYDDIREVVEDHNKIAVQWLEVYTNQGNFLVKAVPGYDGKAEEWVSYCNLEFDADESCAEDGAAPYYFWTLTIPGIPKELIKRLIDVVTFGLVNDTFVLYDMAGWNEMPIPVWTKIEVSHR